MSIEEKYYQPVPEEFKIGFEYQFLSGGKEWKDFVMNFDRIEGVYYNLKAYPEMFRVKYLDRGDCEDLGWTFEKQHPGLDDMTFSKKHDGENLTLDMEDANHIRIYEFYMDGDLNYFSGKIKNKSELKTLMNQLGI